MAKAAQMPQIHVVTESFVVDVDGSPTAYRMGEPIEADDPMIARYPAFIRPLVYPHPVRRHSSLTPPEVRAD